MSQPSVVHSTFVLERSFPVSPERVFQAFADPAQKRRWSIDGGHHTVDYFEPDFRVGGLERFGIRLGPDTPVAGLACTNSTTYLDIVPNRRIAFAAAMAIAGNCISASLATVELLPTATGTDLIFTHQAAFFEGADGPQMREAGWNTLLDNLVAELAR